MNVLVLSHMFPREASDWSGIFVFEQVKALRSMGMDARVIYGDANWHTKNVMFRKIGSFDASAAISNDWEIFEGVPIARFLYHVSPEPLWHKVAPLTYRSGVAKVLRRLSSTFKPNLVHAHTALLDGTAAHAVSRRLRVPYVVTEHTGPFSLVTSNTISRWIARNTIARADRAIAVSRSLRREMLEQLGLPTNLEKAIVLPNGVDTGVFYPGSRSGSVQGEVKFLWVGGFVPIKQPILAIQAFADALKRRPDMTLTMIGRGELEGEMHSAVKASGLETQVTIQGSLGRRELAQAYRDHHCLLVTSSSETFCIVALEAIASGIPVLTTACGGPIDTVGGSTRGQIVADHRSEIANGILNLAEKVSAIDPRALHMFARNYSYENLARQLNDLYREVCGAYK